MSFISHPLKFWFIILCVEDVCCLSVQCYFDCIVCVCVCVCENPSVNEEGIAHFRHKMCVWGGRGFQPNKFLNFYLLNFIFLNLFLLIFLPTQLPQHFNLFVIINYLNRKIGIGSFTMPNCFSFFIVRKIKVRERNIKSII